MSTGRVGKTTNSPDDVVGNALTDERKSMWGEIPGRIVSFDSATQTATIQPLYKPRFNGKPIDMPELLEVPVRFMRAGGYTITTPVSAGDLVTLRPQMRSSENYLAEDDGTASDDRSFNISDMEAHLDGGESLNQPIGGFATGGLQIRSESGETFIEVSGTGIKLVLSAGCYIELTGAGIKMVGPKIDLNP